MGNNKSKNKIIKKSRKGDEKDAEIPIKNKTIEYNQSLSKAPNQIFNSTNKSNVTLTRYNSNDNYNTKNIPKKDNQNINIPNLKLSNSIEDSYTYYCTDNSFIIIDSIDKILYLIYSTGGNSIISFDLLNNKKINEIKSAHKDYIANFKYFQDKSNKKDLIISISPADRNIKLWNLKNLECLFNFINLYKDGTLRESCFIYFNDKIYIATSLFCVIKCEPIKIFDLKGNKIKEINDSSNNTFFIESYFDEKLSKIFIITSNEGYSKSYDFKENKPYFKYYDNDNICRHSLIIKNKDGITKLIESSEDGYIRIWNFHTGILLKRFCIINEWIQGICLWNDELLFIGCLDQNILLIELSNGKIIKKYNGHKSLVLTVKKINHPKLGNCLISQGWKKDKIIIWKTIS